MSAVAGEFGVLVFHNVLLDEGHSCLLTLTLFHSVIVDLSIGEETTVAWDVLSHFGSSN